MHGNYDIKQMKTTPNSFLSVLQQSPRDIVNYLLFHSSVFYYYHGPSTD